jgi:uncharacterized protein YraI
MDLNSGTRSWVGLAAGAVLLALSTGLALAAPAQIASNTNLRQGPGTNYGIIVTVPAGSIVDVSECTPDWCTVHWRGRIGYMIATNLRSLVGQAPALVYADPRPLVYVRPYPYYYGPRYYHGPRYRHWRRW